MFCSPTFNSVPINAAIKKCWTFEDINLSLKTIVKQNKIELSSSRIFLEDTIQSLLKKENFKPEPVFTYLINYIRANDSVTPYSFVSALNTYPSYSLSNNEIIVNSWLADDLHLNKNDTIRLQYYTLESFHKLEEKTSTFVVKDIVEIKDFAADSLLMPAFEGLAGVDHCSDWEAGIPVNFSKIRKKDEAWWEKHKGTPKAFISYQTAVKLWGTHFGNSTSIRFATQTDTNKLKTTLLSQLQPSNIGIKVLDIKSVSQWSASNAVDFSQLFLSLSFFIILAAFLLSSLLFTMMIEQRKKEQGIYLSLGLPKKQIFNIFLAEGLINAVVGSFIGLFAGITVSMLVLHFLNSIWNDVVRTSSIQLFITPTSLVIGFVSNILISIILMRQTLRKHFSSSINNLNKKNKISSSKGATVFLLTAIVASILFILLLIYGLQSDLYQNSSLFFTNGFLLLTALTSWIAFALKKIGTKQQNSISKINIAIRNLVSEFKRTIIIISILSLGVFIVIATGANRTDVKRNANGNSSGTGGYSIFIETNIGVNINLSTNDGRSELGIGDECNTVSFVQLHRYLSDDASCLNLNKIQHPSVLGVNPLIFSKRNSFSFINTIENETKNPWELLNKKLSANCIPAVADQTVITWSLGKSVGDSILYITEKGDTVYLVLVASLENSIFQGNVIISDSNFTKLYPSISGSNIILANINNNKKANIRESIAGALRNYGASIENTTNRLEMFNSVTNTYLDIFVALGGIALIIGTFGFAIVIFRSIYARKQHYAMMQAFGISIKSIRSIILIEFLIILIAGITSGLFAAFIASLPSLVNTNPNIPYPLLITIIGVFTVNGVLWIYLGTLLSIKKNFNENLRNE